MKLIRTAPTFSGPGNVFMLIGNGREYAVVGYAGYPRRTYLDRGPLGVVRKPRLISARCTKLIAAIDAAIAEGRS